MINKIYSFSYTDDDNVERAFEVSDVQIEKKWVNNDDAIRCGIKTKKGECTFFEWVDSYGVERKDSNMEINGTDDLLKAFDYIPWFEIYNAVDEILKDIGYLCECPCRRINKSRPPQ